MLGPADTAARIDADLEQPDLAHPFEMGTYRVGMKPEGARDVVRGKRARRPSELEEDCVAGVVAEGLQHRQPRRLGTDAGTGVVDQPVRNLGIKGHTPRLHGRNR